MKLSLVAVVVVAVAAWAAPVQNANAVPTITRTVLSCSAGGCLVQTCITIGGSTNCSTSLEPITPVPTHPNP